MKREIAWWRGVESTRAICRDDARLESVPHFEFPAPGSAYSASACLRRMRARSR
jgi:hypothetical protein